MFSDSHVIQLFFAFFPALIYSFIIYCNDRGNITLRRTLSYILSAYISIELLRLLFLTFPHIQEMLFTVADGSFDFMTLSPNRAPTTASWLFFAFIQVAFLEEMAKFFSWSCMSLFRGNEYKRSDSLFSTMFYSCMISVGFAALENMDYFIDYGGADIIVLRSHTSVVIHMICGIIMGYFIALSRLKRDKLKSLSLKFLGVLSAFLFHGLYDFTIMCPDFQYIPCTNIKVFYFVILLGLVLATMCGRSLLGHSERYGLVQQRRPPSLPEG